MKNKWFNFLLFLAEMGFFKYDGLAGKLPRCKPIARVLYDDGNYTCNMAMGNAVQYANMFGGKVVPVDKKET